MSIKARDPNQQSDKPWEMFEIPPEGDLKGNINIKMDREDEQALKRWAGRHGFSKTEYVRWLCHVAPKLRMLPHGVKEED